MNERTLVKNHIHVLFVTGSSPNQGLENTTSTFVKSLGSIAADCILTTTLKLVIDT